MCFYSVKELIEEAEKRAVAISTVAKEMEAENQEVSLAEIEQRMLKQWLVMKEAAKAGLKEPKKSMGGLIGGEGKLLEEYRLKNRTLAGHMINKAVSRALAVAEVNASMGKIVAAPTAGSCGILPGVLLTVQEELCLSDEKIADGLFTASAFGIIIAQKASISGAEGGCQAECGAAGAMAGAALVELAGGTPSQAGEACAFVLKNILGLVCDPVAGLVEVPCAKRNAMGAALALVAADMALAGIKSVIPVDEVIEAMGEVGCALPESLRETAKGGLAATATGRMLAKRFLFQGETS
ncbi:MAG: L-serine ammonia-lyase, iron-sulfur-dependent, subunit alpha [Clostridia bacterium]|nr:L-serine ammonia-lyase, iron-sulfur-dependent, subunit alpha [Clostridia bacterium]